MFISRQELMGTEVKVSHVQPGLVATEMTENDDFTGKLKVKSVWSEKRAKILLPEDIAEVIWETASRPGRCYQTEVMVEDMFTKDGQVLAAMMNGN